MHILSPETDNCPSWISGRKRMTVENISWSISTKEYCRPRQELNPRPPVSSRTAHPTEPPRPRYSSLNMHAELTAQSGLNIQFTSTQTGCSSYACCHDHTCLSICLDILWTSQKTAILTHANTRSWSKFSLFVDIFYNIQQPAILQKETTKALFRMC